MLDRISEKHAEEEAEATYRASIYLEILLNTPSISNLEEKYPHFLATLPAEIWFSEHSAVTFWRCQECDSLHASALDENVKRLSCRNGCCPRIINGREKVIDPQNILWHDKPVL